MQITHGIIDGRNEAFIVAVLNGLEYTEMTEFVTGIKVDIDPIYVFYSKGSVPIACMRAHIVRNDNSLYYISGFVVAKSLRGCGIGYTIVRGVIELARETKICNRVELEATEISIEFWRKFGFTEVGIGEFPNSKRLRLIL